MTRVNQEFYKSLGREFLAKYGRLNNFIKHPLYIGNYHEEVLKTSLRNNLPNRYSIKTGFVYVGEGNVSPQVDILIVDENEIPSYLFREGDFVIVHPDAVVFAIEVKSKLTKKSFTEGVKNLTSVRKLSDYRTNKKNPGLIGTALFSFGGSAMEAGTADKWYKLLDPLQDRYYLDYILVLEKSFFTLRPDLSTDGFGGHYKVIVKDELTLEQSLAFFFAIIQKYALMRDGKTEFNPFVVFDEETFWSKEVLKFGEGLVLPKKN